MKKNNILANFALLMTGLIWGVSFVAQRAGSEYVGAFTFNCVRSFLGTLSLLPLVFLPKLFHNDTRKNIQKKLQHKLMLKGGFLCGLALFTAMSIQQCCMKYVSAGKAGFISALYLIFVPIISVFLGKKLNKNVIVSILVAVIGLYLLCFKANSMDFNIYDGILLISAFFYGVHILVVNYFSQRLNAIKLSCLQFLFVCLLSLPVVLLLEHPTIQAIVSAKVPLLYAGILTCGVAYTLQIFGQKYTQPVIASLILSLESVFAVLGGMLILGEVMTGREILGCVFMIVAVILSEIRYKTRRV